MLRIAQLLYTLQLMTIFQYNRTTGVFTPKDEEVSETDIQVCAKLNEALTEVRSWLGIKLRNGKYAHAFLAEMAIGSTDRAFHIHAVYDEIGKLEGADIIPSLTKKPRQMRPPLRGLWHKHYYQASFMPRNLRDETEQMVKDGRWEAIFAPHYGKYIHECINEISHEMIDRAYERRARDRRITGEFIVYERQTDGSNYYLTLGRHGEWDAIRARVDEYKKFDRGENSLP